MPPGRCGHCCEEKQWCVSGTPGGTLHIHLFLKQAFRSLHEMLLATMSIKKEKPLRKRRSIRTTCCTTAGQHICNFRFDQTGNPRLPLPFGADPGPHHLAKLPLTVPRSDPTQAVNTPGCMTDAFRVAVRAWRCVIERVAPSATFVTQTANVET